MARTYESTKVVMPVVQDIEHVTCDRCGKELDEDDDYHLFPHRLEIYLDRDQCVNSRVELDLCVECLGPIWTKVCETIGADPEEELRIGQH